MSSRKRKPMRYRPKSRKKTGFSSTHAILPTIVTIAAAGLICCFGYIVAKPIVQSTNSTILTGDPETSGETTTSAAEDTTETTTTSVTTTDVTVTTAVTTQAQGTAETNVVIISGGETVSTQAAPAGGFSGIDGTGVGYGDASGAGSDGSTSTETGTGSGSGSNGTSSESGSGTGTDGSSGGSSGTNSNPNSVYNTVGCSVRLPESSVSSADALRKMLETVKQQNPSAGAVVIPMKLPGGALNYQSYVAGEAAWSVCQGSMTASEIASIVKEAGLYAYASCNLLEDHLYPTVYSYRRASYMIEKNGVQNGDQWLDNYADKGGKPWLDPGSDVTQAYLRSIVQELSESGFSAVLCSGFTYPSFGPSDEKYLNPDIFAKKPDSMVALANSLQQAAGSSIDIVLDLSASGVSNGWELVYQPDQLRVPYAVFGDSGTASSADGSHSVLAYN